MKMQSKLATVAILGLVATTSYAAPSLYGLFDVSVDYLPENNKTTADRDVVEVSSNTSFIGVKGTEKINDRLGFVYQADFGYDLSGKDDSGADILNRTRFVGIKDEKLGTLRVGYQDTPVKLLSSAVDSFNGRVNNVADVHGIMTGENRISNTVMYLSPDIKVATGKVNVNVLTATGEASGAKTINGGYKVSGRGLGDSFSTSVVYSQPEFVIGVGYDKAIPSRFVSSGFLNASERVVNRSVIGSNVVASADTVRVTGRYNFKEQGVAVKGLYQRSEVSSAKSNHVASGTVAQAANIDNATAWLIGAEYNLPNQKAITTRAQYSQSTTSFKDGTPDYEAKQILAGAEYAFNKQANAYVQAGYLEIKHNGEKDKQPVLGTGLAYKF